MSQKTMYNCWWKSYVARVVWLGVLVSLFLFIIYPIQRAELQLTLETPDDSSIRVYWAAANESFSARRSSLVDYPDGGGVIRLKLGDLKDISRLRLQASLKREVVLLKNISIQQVGYNPIGFVFPSASVKITPGENIQSLSLENKTISFVSTRFNSRLIISFVPVPVSENTKLIQLLAGLSGYVLFSTIASICFWAGCALFIRFVRMLKSLLPDEGLLSEGDGNRCFSNKNKIITVISCSLLLIMWFVLFEKGESDFFAKNVFGTGNAPYSDALTWLRGTCNYLNNFPNKTCRPTINLFIGSIYSMTGVLQAVPLFSIILFAFNSILICFVGSRAGKAYQLILLFLLAIFFNQLVRPLNIGQIMMDFPPFVFTCIGVFFIGYALKFQRIHIGLLYLGLFCVGVAAAVRGVQLAGGLIITLGVIAVIWERTKKVRIFLPVMFFTLPILLDSFLQRKYGIYNNGLYSLFCFYNDTHHSYTKAGKQLLKALHLSGAEVLLSYFRYLFTVEGLRVFGGYLEDILSFGFTHLQTKIYYLLLLICGFAAVCRSFVFFSSSGEHETSESSNFRWLKIKKLNGQLPSYSILQVFCHCLLVPGLIWVFPHHSSWILGIYLLAILVVSATMRLYLTSTCLAMYIGAGILFAMKGMPGKDRVLASFAFTLPLGYLLFLIEDYRLFLISRKKQLIVLVMVNVLTLSFLYAGQMILPMGQNGFALKEKTVRKISDDAQLNLSLYYSDTGLIFILLTIVTKLERIVPTAKFTAVTEDSMLPLEVLAQLNNRDKWLYARK